MIQYLPKINVGRRILRNDLIFLHLITETLTVNDIFSVLQFAINPVITIIVKHSVDNPEDQYIFE